MWPKKLPKKVIFLGSYERKFFWIFFHNLSFYRGEFCPEKTLADFGSHICGSTFSTHDRCAYSAPILAPSVNHWENPKKIRQIFAKMWPKKIAKKVIFLGSYERKKNLDFSHNLIFYRGKFCPEKTLADFGSQICGSNFSTQDRATYFAPILAPSVNHWENPKTIRQIFAKMWPKKDCQKSHFFGSYGRMIL